MKLGSECRENLLYCILPTTLREFSGVKLNQEVFVVNNMKSPGETLVIEFPVFLDFVDFSPVISRACFISFQRALLILTH